MICQGRQASNSAMISNAVAAAMTAIAKRKSVARTVTTGPPSSLRIGYPPIGVTAPGCLQACNYLKRITGPWVPGLWTLFSRPQVTDSGREPFKADESEPLVCPWLWMLRWNQDYCADLAGFREFESEAAK